MRNSLAVVALFVVGCSSNAASTPVDAGASPSPLARSAAEVVADVRRVPGAGALLDRGLPLRYEADAIVAQSSVRLPRASDGPLVLPFAKGSLTLRFVGRSTEAKLADNAAVYADVAPGIDMLLRVGARDFEQLHVVREASPTVVLRHHVELAGKLTRLESRGDHVIVFADDGTVVAQTAPAFAVDAAGRRRSVRFAIEGDVLVASLDARDLELPIVVDPQWLVTSAPKEARAYGSAARVDDTVIVLGGVGEGSSTPISTVEAYDASKDTWTVRASRTEATTLPAVAVLADGRMLVAGGGAAAGLRSTAELYDAKTDKWTATTGAMTTARAGAAAVRLPTGDVLVTGGGSAFARADNLSTAEVYETAKGTFRAVSAMKYKHGATHRSFLLSSGKVLVVGGGAAAEIWDPTADTWTPSAGAPAYLGVASAALRSGKILAVGGFEGADWQYGTKYADAALFDPATETWTAAPAVPIARGFGDLVPFGKGALLFGGIVPGSDLELTTNRTSLYDEAKGVWSAGERMITPHTFGAVAVLASGAVSVTSGILAKQRPFSNAEIYGRVNGDPCDDTNGCISGICVDGVCCNSACDGQCEACDIPGGLGRCWPVTGKPHGARTACDVGGIDVCKAKACDGTVDRKSCTAFANGLSTSCGAAHCDVGNFVGVGHCNGKGDCVSPLPSACTPFACTPDGCGKTCGLDQDCAESFRCEEGTCKPIDAACSADGLVSQPRAGGDVACAPYRCDPARGTCRTTCTSSDECSPNSVCDVGAGTCTPASATSASADEGGCAFGVKPGPLHFGWLALLAVAAGRRRRVLR